jgi:hypothetical protein
VKLKPNQDRARYATICMYVMIVLSLSSLGFQYYSAHLGPLFMREDYDDLVFMALMVALIAVAITIIAAIFFIMWFRRAYYNLHQLSPGGLQHSEGWAAGAWFIPIFNFWGPYQIATDLFKETELILVNNNLAEANPARHQIKNWWWGLWIASILLGRVEAYGENTSMSMALLTTAISVASAVLAILMIKSYHEMEILLPKISAVTSDAITDDDLLDSGL